MTDLVVQPPQSITGQHYSRFDTFYQVFNPIPKPIKYRTHFVEWFSGEVIDTIWTETDLGNGGDVAMSDEINGGFKMTTAAIGLNDSITMSFNDINHYEPTGSIAVYVQRIEDAFQSNLYCGFVEDKDHNDDKALMGQDHNVSANFFLYTRNGSDTFNSTDIIEDNNYHVFKLILTPTNTEGFMEGVLKATNTTTLPNVALQPTMFLRQRTTAVAKVGHILYYEAYNT